MRRTPVLAATLAALAVTAGAAQADVTDVIVTTSLPGTLTITGAGSLPTAPLGVGGETTVGATSTGIAGSVLTVNDSTGATTGWQVNAKYVPLDTDALASVLALAGDAVAAKNIGGENVTVNGATGALATTNALLGVADGGLTFTGGNLSDVAAGRTLLSTNGDGRGVTAFNTSYALNLPAKSTAANTLYTGSILYTVGPKPTT